MSWKRFCAWVVAILTWGTMTGTLITYLILLFGIWAVAVIIGGIAFMWAAVWAAITLVASEK